MAHKTKDWSATETTDFTGGRRKLTVTGQVQTLKTSEKLILAEAKPQGINPTVLILDLSVSSAGIGGDIVQWHPIEFTTPVSSHEYHDVTIRDGDALHTVKVQAIAS